MADTENSRLSQPGQTLAEQSEQELNQQNLMPGGSPANQPGKYSADQPEHQYSSGSSHSHHGHSHHGAYHGDHAEHHHGTHDTHSTHHDTHHHRSSPPVHALHKVQRSIRHTMKHIQKWQITAAAVFGIALIVFAGVCVQKYQEKKRTEAELAAWYAANGLEGQGPAAGAQNTAEAANTENSSKNAENSPENADAGTNSTQAIDYAPLSTNNFTAQLALRRPQPFLNKEVLYGGQKYTRNTAVKAILLMGLDRSADDLQQIRPELWEQGQTDLMLLIAHNISRNTVEVLQIPRDTMAAMKAVADDGQQMGDTVEQITLAFGYGDGVYKSCELACDAVTRLLGGLSIDHYMLADLKTINTVNDLAGGVTVTIPDDRAVWNDPAFVKGQKITLRGDQAERFVRSRDQSDDFSSLLRMEHQKIYLQAFQNQVKSCIKKDPDFLDELFDAVDADILSDMNRKDLVKLAGGMVNTAQLDDSDFRMLPGEAQMGETYLEYIPHYADINETVLDMFYRKVN